MASYGDALVALDDFRTEMLNALVREPAPAGQAMAFRSAAGEMAGTALRNVHATGVGVRGSNDFVIKVYVFEQADVQAAASVALLSRARDGVDVDVEYLPVQMAFGTAPARAARRPGAPKATANPAQHRKRRRPVPGGVEIGPLGGNFVGTLGCFVRGGSGEDGPLSLLSNNHVLADVNRFPIGTKFTQPFSSNSTDVIAALTAFEPILFPTVNSQPRNVMDAAIAVVADTSQVALKTMLNIANYNPLLMAARPGMAVIKSGRTTGVTTGSIRAIRVRGVQVNYGTRQNPIIATFDNAITITATGAGPFSNPGDSGSVILDKQSGRPVALLFAGDATTTTACDMTAVCTRFGVHPV